MQSAHLQALQAPPPAPPAGLHFCYNTHCPGCVSSIKWNCAVMREERSIVTSALNCVSAMLLPGGNAG